MKKNSFFTFGRWDMVFLALILIVALAFRVYRLQAPLADFHSWRQADTAATARNFVKNGYDLLHPRFDDLSNVASGMENTQGYRFVEFPLYNAFMAKLYELTPTLSLEAAGRLVSILFSLVIIVCLYYLALKEFGRVAAVAASFLYAVFPFFVFFSRVVLPETTALAFAVLSITFLYLFSYGKGRASWLFFTLSLLSFAVAILIKPTVIFYGLVLVYLFVIKYRLDVVKRPGVYLFFILSVAPLFFWRSYISQFPEGIPASDWLLTSVNTPAGLQNIFMRPAFFRWIFFERINNVILGGYLTFFLIIGVVFKFQSRFLLTFIGSALLYLLFFQGGNVQHEYYQTVILPPLALACGVGIQLFLGKKWRGLVHPSAAFITVITIVLFSFAFSYFRVKDYYNYSTDLPQIAKIIQSLTKPDDLVITDTTGDTTLLYLANRRGSPVQFRELPEMKERGFSYLVTFEQEKITKLKEEGIYPILFENDKLAIFHL